MNRRIHLKKLKNIYKKSYVFNIMEISNKYNPIKVKKYEKKIHDYLTKYRVGQGSNIKYTHVSMGDTFVGKFLLDNNTCKEFNELYAEAIENGAQFNIAEKPKTYGPILIDIDLEILKEDYVEGTRLYDENMYFEIINMYRKVLLNFLDLDSKELIASLFEKPNPTMKPTTVKDGFHIIFHNITAHNKLRHLVRYYVVRELKDNPIFSKFTKDINDIIDKAVVDRNCWCMPGSKKKDGYLYELTNIYDKHNEIVESNKIKNNKNTLLKCYSLQDEIRCEEEMSVYLSEDMFDEIEDEYSQFCEKQTNINTVQVFISEDKEDLIRKATFLVSLLSDDRNDSYESWLRLGWALHNIDYSLLNVWIEFSRRSPKFKDGECEQKWNLMRNEGLTIRSLMYWAEEDNYQKYHEFMATEFSYTLNKSLDGSTYNIAKALYAKYMDRFVCANIKDNVWYEFVNHRWILVEEGYTLRKEISENFVNEYHKLIAKYAQINIELSGDSKEENTKKTGKIIKITQQLMNISFKDKIIREAKDLFFDNEFIKKLDENYDIIGFNNGVYDLVNNEFRNGRPDDYISKNCGVDYYVYNPHNPYAEKMHKFFKEILPNEAVRKYTLVTLATCVAGHNKEEKCRIFTGSGSNGKSLLFSLVQAALGDYYISCPITIITRKRNSSNAASPELERIKGARCGCFQETDNDEKLNVGILKEITGNDSFMVRALYSKPIEIKPQIKFFLACNQLPEVPSTDGGVWRRLRVVNFSSKFVEKPIKSNEFLIDNNLKSKIKEWAPLFASYLIHLYINEYKKMDILIEPDEVKLSTESYKAENDPFSEYYGARIMKTDNPKDSINIKTIYDDFKNWYKSTRDVSKTPPQLELVKFLVEKMGEMKNNKWKGYTFKNNYSDDDESVIGTV